MTTLDTERKLMNQKFRTRLRQLLDETGQSQRSLAQALGVSGSVISKYLSDPNKDALFHNVAKIAQHFDVSPEWLGGMTDERIPFKQGDITGIYFRLSSFGKEELYHYGQYLLSQEESVEEEGGGYSPGPRPRRPVPASREPESVTVESAALKVIPKVADFAVMVRGDAMEPLIKNGTVVFAKDQSTVEPGDIVLAEVDGKLTCRKYHLEGRRVELHPENPLFEPITKYQSIKILGKVII